MHVTQPPFLTEWLAAFPRALATQPAGFMSETIVGAPALFRRGPWSLGAQLGAAGQAVVFRQGVASGGGYPGGSWKTPIVLHGFIGITGGAFAASFGGLLYGSPWGAGAVTATPPDPTPLGSGSFMAALIAADGSLQLWTSPGDGATATAKITVRPATWTAGHVALFWTGSSVQVYAAQAGNPLAFVGAQSNPANLPNAFSFFPQMEESLWAFTPTGGGGSIIEFDWTLVQAINPGVGSK